MIVQEAADRTDWGTVYDCMTEGLQKRYALGFLITLDPEMNAGSPWRDKCQSVLVRHGLGAEDQNNRKRSRDPNEDIELLADSIKDRRGLFVDALNLIVEMDDESKIEPFLFPGELTNVSIDGDVATATRKWKIGDRERPSAMSFKKVNGSWFLD
ncbi:MAG TPA: hypothetical protein VMY37_39320 [Thermoguttaceae bacterium]|nr:hypothetical protein [Thermoguttaceae bacterium]